MTSSGKLHNLYGCYSCAGERNFTTRTSTSSVLRFGTIRFQRFAASSTRKLPFSRPLSRSIPPLIKNSLIKTIFYVPGRGIEPPRVTSLLPKSSASTNFATPARTLIIPYIPCPINPVVSLGKTLCALSPGFLKLGLSIAKIYYRVNLKNRFI